MRSLGKRRLGVFAAVAAALAIVGGGVAWATIPGADGTITACMQKNGSVRLIDPSVTNCKHSEKQVAWNVAGQPGQPGSGGAAAYAKWNGAGGVNYKALDNGVTTPLVTLTLPDGFTTGDVVATTTVWITNWLDEPVWGSCGVYSEYGGADSWPFTLTHGFNLLSFQVEVSGTDGPLTVKCSLDDVDPGNPPASGQVWAEVASLSAIPVATP